MDFNLDVPQTVDLNYGVQAYYDDVLALAHAYPMIAVYDDEGWNAEIPPQSGDVTYADMSFFIVTVEAPKDVTLVGSGREISRQKTETGKRSGMKRDRCVIFIWRQVRNMKSSRKKSNGVTLRFYTRRSFEGGAEVCAGFGCECG